MAKLKWTERIIIGPSVYGLDNTMLLFINAVVER